MTRHAPEIKIDQCRLYAVTSPRDLARRLSTPEHVITVEDLAHLTNDAPNYKLFSITQGTKKRRIQEPKRQLQKIHLRIHKLLSRVEAPEYLHSAIKGKSYLSNARSHQPNTPIVKIDIKSFFESVPYSAIYKFFLVTMRCRKDVSRILADLLTFAGHLPTGSSASPIISYYAFMPMFEAISRIASTYNVKMTCYVDDMAFSGENATNAVLHSVKVTIAKFGLRSHKARQFSASNPKVVTGICITSKGDRVPNKLHLKINEGFERLKTEQDEKAKRKILNSLLGRLEAAGQIDPKFRARARGLRNLQTE